MRIAIVNPFFGSPSTAGSARMWEMVTHFSMKNEVMLVTSNIDYRTGKSLPDHLTRDYDSIRGVSVVFLPMLVSGKHPVTRALREIAFAFGVSRLLRSRSLGLDCVIISSPPLFSMYSVATAKRLGIPTVLEIRDPWPDAIAAQGISLPSPAISLLRRIERLGLRNADHCVTLTEGIEALMKERTTGPVTTITNMAPSIVDETRARSSSASISVVSAGSIGGGDGFPQYFEPVFRFLTGHGEIKFRIYGDGSARPHVERVSDECSNVTFHGSVSRAELQYHLRQCDVAVMYSYPGLYSRIGLYNKFIDYLAAGLPIILAGSNDGVMPSIIHEYHCGVVVSHEHPEEMVRELIEISRQPDRRCVLGSNALIAARELFDRNVVMERYDRVVAEAVGSANK